MNKSRTYICKVCNIVCWDTDQKMHACCVHVRGCMCVCTRLFLRTTSGINTEIVSPHRDQKSGTNVAKPSDTRDGLGAMICIKAS